MYDCVGASTVMNLNIWLFFPAAVAEDETVFKSDQSEDGDNQSDYFADVETSSCGSSEVDAGWSDSDIYDGL